MCMASETKLREIRAGFLTLLVDVLLYSSVLSFLLVVVVAGLRGYSSSLFLGSQVFMCLCVFTVYSLGCMSQSQNESIRATSASASMPSS